VISALEDLNLLAEQTMIAVETTARRFSLAFGRDDQRWSASRRGDLLRRYWLPH